MLIDTHAHLDGEEFAPDLGAVLERAEASGVGKIFIPNISPETLPTVDRLCSEHEGFLYPMIGLHPENIGTRAENDAFMSLMRSRLAADNRYIAIGEVGLDFYWDVSRKEEQERVFSMQVDMASEFGLPLMIHARSAHESLVKEMERSNAATMLTGVFHCFTGTDEEAEQLLSYPGFMLGIGGVSTFRKSTLPEVLSRSVPLSRIVLETDSPYMAPVPNRGKRNESSFVACVAEKLASVYGVSRQEVEDVTTANALKVFKKVSIG